LTITRPAASGDERAFRKAQDKAVASILASPDLIEGATAFVEKRTPVWRT
jgi:enoyl-CoA hydratase/carnithine racemase